MFLFTENLMQIRLKMLLNFVCYFCLDMGFSWTLFERTAEGFCWSFFWQCDDVVWRLGREGVSLLPSPTGLMQLSSQDTVLFK